MEKIIQGFAYWQKARSCGPGCEQGGERFSWTGAAPPTHVCFSEVNLGPPTPQYFPLVTVPTISFQIARRAEVLECYHPH